MPVSPVLPFAELLFLGFLVVTAIVHVALAVGVYRAAANLSWCGEQVWFMPPVFWMLATFATGLIAALAYWLIHHSSLRAPRRQELADTSS